MSDLVPIYSPNDIFWANLALGLSLGLGIAFGAASIAFAIWFGYAGRMRDFLRDSKRGQVDEKIAVIIGHILRYRDISSPRITISLSRTVPFSLSILAFKPSCLSDTLRM
ncbi:MAG: hypothetical protein WCF46_04700, partial [Nitrososphaeraceae archaeon]